MAKLRNIMITTQHRGVFLAQVKAGQDLTPKTLTDLKNACMVVRWRNDEGLQGMARTGPTDNCKISPQSDLLVVHDVTAVFDVSDTAAAKIWK
jgi:hypothetical protein